MSDRSEAIRFMERHGSSATVGQTSAPEYRFFVTDEGAAAYVDTGRAWVVAGAPWCAAEELAATTDALVAAARSRGRRICFFGVDESFVATTASRALRIAEQPEWDPARWDEVLRDHRRMREQLRRARAKGVKVRVLAPGWLVAEPELRARIDRVRGDWLASRGMPGMGFVAAVPPVDAGGERVWLVAERDGSLVAVATLLPVPARRGTLVEHVFREPEAPNGTLELLVDAAMRGALPNGSAWLTLGMVALAGSVPWILRVARWLGELLYGFDGIRRARARLRPMRWTPLYLAFPRRQSVVLSVFDLLTAFAGGSLLRFGLRTIAHRWARLRARVAGPRDGH